jgi:hypothetical protein
MPEVETQGRPLSQVERVVDTFVAPSATFRDVLRSSSWWLPFVLLALSSWALSWSIDRKVGFEQLTENQIHMSPAREAQFNSLEPAARAESLRKGAVVAKYISFAYPVLILFMASFAAMLLWATFNFGLGARTTFGQMLCIWMYASLPRILTILIAVVTLWFGGSPESFNPQYPVGTNPGYYFSDSPAWLRTFLSFFDVVGIWTVILLVLGTAIVARTTTGRAAAAIIGWWVLILGVSVIASAAFS